MRIFSQFKLIRLIAFVAVLALTLCSSIAAQEQSADANLPSAPTPQTQPTDDRVTISGTPLRLLKDQEAIWTSPLHLREDNVLGPAALVLATTVLVATDHQVMSKQKLQNTSLNDKASTASTGLVGGFIAAPAGIFALGAIHHDEHATETGILDGEAVADSIAVSEVIKAITQRERPTLDNAKGKFFQSGVGLDSSFPSNHAIVAWSSAAVLASEYNGMGTKIVAYGLASGVSVSRILARQHFPSDVLVGSALGWMIGRYVEHRHHRAD